MNSDFVLSVCGLPKFQVTESVPPGRVGVHRSAGLKGPAPHPVCACMKPRFNAQSALVFLFCGIAIETIAYQSNRSLTLDYRLFSGLNADQTHPSSGCPY